MHNKQSECALWFRPETHFLLTRSLNNKKKKYCAIDFRPGLSWSMAQSIFSSSNSNSPKMRLNTPRFLTHERTYERKCICYLNNAAQDRKMRTVGLKLAKTHARALHRIAAGV